MFGVWCGSVRDRIVVTSEDDGVEAGFAPQLHEVNHVPEAQGWMTGEHHTRLTELTAEVSVDARVVLQLVGLDQLKQQRSTCKTEVCKRLKPEGTFSQFYPFFVVPSA